jgi:glycosyltransferase involved in cell wall biosynthesis
VVAVHILFLTDNFPPEVNAPASRTYEHCREWVKAGHSVTVITGQPNFPRGRVFDGYKNRWRTTEMVDGIKVVRTWTYITANEGFIKRTLDYLSFMAMATIAAMGVRRPDVIVATSPQFFTACAGCVVSRLRRAPWVFELRDMWPESIRAVGAMKEGIALRLLERLELFLYRDAAAVVSVTHAFKSNLVQRGVAGAKIHVVTNGADLSHFKPRPRDLDLARALGLEGCFVAGYVGTHGMAHALDTLLDAAELVRERPGGEKVRLLLLGDGASKEALQARAKAKGLTNVVFVDSVPKAEVARFWSLLDVAVIHLKRTPLFRTVIPSKLFECMAMGLPVLHGVEGESAEIVIRDGAGVVFEPENAAALADALLRMAADAEGRLEMASRALSAASRYDRVVLAASLLETLDKITAKGE